MKTFGNSKIEQIRGLNADNIKNNAINPSEKLIQHDDREVITRTELNDKQIKHATINDFTAEILDNDLMKTFLNSFLHAQISRNRMSRREFIENNQSIQTNTENIARGGLGSYLKQQV